MFSSISYDPTKPFQIVPSLKSNSFLLIKRLILKNPNLIAICESLLSAEKARSEDLHYLLPIVDYAVIGKVIFLMSECVTSLSLGDFLRRQLRKLSERECLQIIQCIITGIEELKKSRPETIHGNLNKSNVYILTDIDDEYICKLTDYHKVTKITGNIHNSYSIAPELLEQKEGFSSENLMNLDFEKSYSKADVWSIGWLLYELLFGKELWDYSDLKRMAEFITSENISHFFDSSQGVSDLAIEFLKKCLVYHPEHRISWAELTTDPLFHSKVEKVDKKHDIVRVDLKKVDLNLLKEESFSRFTFEVKGLEELFAPELHVKNYANEFNLINRGYDFEILESFLIFTEGSDFQPLRGKVCYKVYDKINQKNFIVRVFKVELDNLAFSGFLKDVCFEYVLSKIQSKIGLNILRVYEIFVNNLDCIDYFGNYLILLYDDFNFFLQDIFEGLTQKTIELTVSQKLFLFLSICREFNQMKQNNFQSLQAIHPQNIVFYRHKVTNKFSVKLAFFNDVNHQSKAVADSANMENRNFEQIWMNAVYHLGTFFYQLFTHKKFMKMKVAGAGQEFGAQKGILDLFELMTANENERISLDGLISKLEESPLMEDKNLDFLKGIQREKCKLDENTIKKSYAEIYETLFHFKKAASIYEKLLENEKSEEITSEFITKIAMNYHNDGDADKANSSCVKGLNLLKSEKMKLQHVKYKLNLINGISLMQLGLPDKSLPYLESSFKIGEKIRVPHTYAQLLCFKHLCDNQKALGKTNKALSLNEKSLDSLKKIKEDTPLKRKLMLEYLLNFSQTYLMMENFTKAIEFCNDALIFHERNFLEFHPFLKQCYVSMGNINFIQGAFDKAINNFEYAINVNSKIFPPEHESFIDLNYDLGTVYSKTSASPSSYLKYFEKALELSLKNTNCRKTEKEKREQMSLIYSSIARANYELNKFDQAIDFFQRALTIDKELYPEMNNLRVVEEYLLLGNSYSCLANYELALKNCLEALKIGERLLPENDEKMVDILFDLGDICNNLKKVEEGVGHYERIIKIYEKNKKINNDNKIFEVFMAISNLYMSLGNFDQAIKALLAGQQKYRTINKGEYSDPIIISVLNSIGALYSSTNALDKAIKTYNESLEISKKHFAHEEKLILDALIGIAISYFNQEDFEKAIKFFQEALDLKERKKERGANVGDLCSNISFAFKSLKNSVEAKKYAKKAVDYYQESLPPNHKDLFAAQELLKNLS